ncbi:MAG: MmgE/PrpD family protein [Dehalococcoidia bacterium]|nr:MmgE/PrpD family protein [Dehalococcoidia bacterium]
MQITYKFVDHIIGTKFEDLGGDVVDSVKKQVLDTLATALGGGSCEGIREVYEIVKDWGGKKESSIINFGGKFPAPNAVMVNAAMAHALDYDDTHEVARIHCAVVSVPIALAVAEAVGGVSGKELITAIALGVDFHCRMGMAAKIARPNVLQGGWHFTTMFGYLAATAVAGRLYGLDREKLINALGIAYHQTSGNLQCISEGALTKRMGPGLAARAGILSAQMASRGITGAKDIIESEIGIFKLYHAGYDEVTLLEGLGKKFASTGTSFKPYPCCRINHPFLDGMLKVVIDNDIRPEDVIEIVPETPTVAALLCEPVEAKTKPKNIVDSQFSLPWSLACAVVRRKAGLDEYSNEAIKDPALIDMALRVKPHLDDSIVASLETPVKIAVKTKRGDFTATTSGHVLGSPENSLSLDFLEDKFMNCAAHAIKPLTQKDMKKVVSSIRNLERAEDAGAVIKPLC